MNKFYTLLVALLITATTFAQSPKSMSYQAVVRDGSDILVSNTTTPIQISILQGTIAVYVETQTPTTNANGLLSIEIGGSGAVVVSGVFSDIIWGTGTYFIKTEVDVDNNASYDVTGTSQLLSVPYALHSKNGVPTGGTEGQVLTIIGGAPVWSEPAPVCTDIFYLDSDGDGYGDVNITFVACTAPNGYVVDNTDCDDINASINPDLVWYLDADSDGYAVSTVAQCNSPRAGYTTTVLPLTDCNDNDSNVNDANRVWYLDADSDGYAVSTSTQCNSPGAGYTTTVLPLTDCDDNDSNANDANRVWYLDADSDGYAVSTVTNVTQCNSPGTGYTIAVRGFGDCNDTDNNINPGVLEIGGDGIDNDCDQEIDELFIGQFGYGGVVFYLAPTPTDLDGDGDLDTGLVCALQDQSRSIKWYNDSNSVTGATGTVIGTGFANTDAIIANQGAIQTNYAAGKSRAYTGGGFINWFLPSKDELAAMYLNRAAINAAVITYGGSGILSSAYWSSTEADNMKAWLHNFNVDAKFEYFKNTGFRVRAVRAF
jgi:hypothetical protein